MYFGNDEEHVKIVLGEYEYELFRARLGLHLHLRQIRTDPVSAGSVRLYLKAYGLPETGTGLELMRAYATLVRLNNVVLDLPMFKLSGGTKSQIDYPHRWALLWVHTIANRYHWAHDIILGLRVEEAAAYLQEIALDEQVEAEWSYSLSPNAYSYDSASKTSKFVPLKRPGWMTHLLPKDKIATRIPEMFMPQGPITKIGSL